METTILKEEKVGFLKSKMNLLQGHLYLHPDRLVLEAHKTGVSGMGLLGNLLKKKVEAADYGFQTALSDITKVEKGKHGFNTVLEVTDAQQSTYRIMVKDCDAWEAAIREAKAQVN